MKKTRNTIGVVAFSDGSRKWRRKIGTSGTFWKQGAGEMNSALIVESLKTGDHTAMKAALVLPEELAGFLPPEATTIREAQEFPRVAPLTRSDGGRVELSHQQRSTGAGGTPTRKST